MMIETIFELDDTVMENYLEGSGGYKNSIYGGHHKNCTTKNIIKVVLYAFSFS